jgi:hypothetical protein
VQCVIGRVGGVRTGKLIAYTSGVARQGGGVRSHSSLLLRASLLPLELQVLAPSLLADQCGLQAVDLLLESLPFRLARAPTLLELTHQVLAAQGVCHATSAARYGPPKLHALSHVRRSVHGPGCGGAQAGRKCFNEAQHGTRRRAAQVPEGHFGSEFLAQRTPSRLLHCCALCLSFLIVCTACSGCEVLLHVNGASYGVWARVPRCVD